jgi:hypothetical protein
MSNIINFPDREYKIAFKMPNSKVVQIRKTSQDDIRIDIENNSVVAVVKAVNLHEAQDKVKRVFPNSSIIEEPWIAG